MRRRYFTEEEQENLAANPYTHRVSAAQIEFTADFKKEFWERRSKGDSISEAFENLGYDPDVLGYYRMRRVSQNLRTQMKAGEEPTTGRRPRGSRKAEETTGPESCIADLQRRVEFLENQVDFLKRMMPVKTSTRSVTS